MPHLPPAKPPVSRRAPTKRHRRLGDLLVDRHLIARADVDRAAVEARAGRVRLGEYLIQRGLADEGAVYGALAVQWGLPFGELDALAARLEPAVTNALPRAYLQKNAVIPLCQQGEDLILATTDPGVNADDVTKAIGGRAAQVFLVTPADYAQLWRLSDTRQLEAGRSEPPPPSRFDPGTFMNPVEAPADGPEVDRTALFDSLLVEAVAERASDVHLECYGADVRIRLRVDGDLRPFRRFVLAKVDLPGLLIVIKVAANLDISERRLPQGGRIHRVIDGSSYDLRVQTQPSLYGEHVILRLLPEDTRVLSIEDLGFPGVVARDYRRLLDSPGGLVLVVGPTGSGKSTTLQAGLQHIARDESRKAITIEDPIEFAIPGVQQVQVRPEIGFVFASAMRAFVRQDPDVIVVGEIRDEETALEAIRASQTGHLVLSTLHCNDAVDAVQRLVDLGMHPTSVASEVLAVIAQRLAKRICLGCRELTEPEPDIFAELFPAGAPATFRCFRGRGCPQCGGHGTHGRVAVIEYLRGGGLLRRGIARRVPSDDLREIALRAGLVTLRQTALALVDQGIIALAELPWILPPERMAEETRAGVHPAPILSFAPPERGATPEAGDHGPGELAPEAPSPLP